MPSDTSPATPAFAIEFEVPSALRPRPAYLEENGPGGPGTLVIALPRGTAGRAWWIRLARWNEGAVRAPIGFLLIALRFVKGNVSWH